jgi:hypothetical protein
MYPTPLKSSRISIPRQTIRMTELEELYRKVDDIVMSKMRGENSLTYYRYRIIHRRPRWTTYINILSLCLRCLSHFFSHHVS